MGALIGRYASANEEQDILPSRVVQTKYGPIEGKRIIADGEHPVDAFLGVPFAKAPIGELRFKKPEPPESWVDVKKAVSFGNCSIQPDNFLFRLMTGGEGGETSEDCLFLNVFAPAWTSPSGGELFPVMVFVHGGGFSIGSTVRFGDVGIAKYLVRHGIIVVTTQYRLGPLGFFSTGDKVCPGNLGLWDMTFALRWVQENIAAFNGDKNRVTVFGQSSGGASVDLLALSPHSRDLFQQVIPMAGNADCSWALSQKCVQASRDLAAKLGCPIEDSGAMVECLRQKPASSLVGDANNGFQHYDIDKMSVDFGPVFDGDFFPRSLAELRREAPLKKWMFGSAEVEGLLFCMNGRQNIGGIDNIIVKLIPEEKHIKCVNLREDSKARYLSKTYTDKKSITRAHIELYSDYWINNATYTAARAMMEGGNEVYLYSFDYINPKSLGMARYVFPFCAPTHTTELAYLFRRSYIPFKFSEDDYKMIDIMTELFANFAKYGNPNGKGDADSANQHYWQPLTAQNDDRYLSINLNPSMKEHLGKGNPKHWASLPSE